MNTYRITDLKSYSYTLCDYKLFYVKSFDGYRGYHVCCERWAGSRLRAGTRGVAFRLAYVTLRPDWRNINSDSCAGFSRHLGGSIEGPLKPLGPSQQYCIERFQGEPSIGSPLCREMLVSQTANVIFPNLADQGSRAI